MARWDGGFLYVRKEGNFIITRKEGNSMAGYDFITTADSFEGGHILSFTCEQERLEEMIRVLKEIEKEDELEIQKCARFLNRFKWYMKEIDRIYNLIKTRCYCDCIDNKDLREKTDTFIMKILKVDINAYSEYYRRTIVRLLEDKICERIDKLQNYIANYFLQKDNKNILRRVLFENDDWKYIICYIIWSSDKYMENFLNVINCLNDDEQIEVIKEVQFVYKEGHLRNWLKNSFASDANKFTHNNLFKCILDHNYYELAIKLLCAGMFINNFTFLSISDQLSILSKANEYQKETILNNIKSITEVIVLRESEELRNLLDDDVKNSITEKLERILERKDKYDIKKGYKNYQKYYPEEYEKYLKRRKKEKLACILNELNENLIESIFHIMDALNEVE